jgi:gamma-glutamylaminecyclotransferase
MTPIFIFGTAKQGFPQHDAGVADAPCLGPYRTIERYPVIIGGLWYAPMMFDEPGTGLQVHGELYVLDVDQLARLDELESMGTPGNFRRPVRIERIGNRAITTAFAYMKSRALAVPVHSGYIADYQDRRFTPPWERAPAG